jgi:putative FmdB family regulatory protein
MATYDFVCQQCANEFEVFVSGFLKEQDKRCPQCQSTDVRQKFSSFLRNVGSSGSSGSSDGCSSPRRSGFG